MLNPKPGSPDEPLDEPADSSGNARSPSQVDWSALVAKVQSGDSAGMAQLYAVFSRGIKYCLYRKLGPEHAEDKMHDTFLIVVKAIQSGQLREPERLMGFVRTVMQRQIALQIEKTVTSRCKEIDLDIGSAVPNRTSTPEQDIIVKEKAELMKSALQALLERDREILGL